MSNRLVQAKLKFFFGTMGSGKSTQALQIHHNLTSRGLEVLLISQLDRAEGRVSSRLGVSAEAQIISPVSNLFDMADDYQKAHGLDAIVCDEAQFYSPTQIEQLAMAVDLLGVDVYAFGLLTSFQGELFAGTARLLELADERSELQVEARCFCGRRATHNARLVNGRQVYTGALIAVGDTEIPADRDRAVDRDRAADRDGGRDRDRSQRTSSKSKDPHTAEGATKSANSASSSTVSYELRCRFHWHEEKWEADGTQLRFNVELEKPRRSDPRIVATQKRDSEPANDAAASERCVAKSECK